MKNFSGNIFLLFFACCNTYCIAGQEDFKIVMQKVRNTYFDPAKEISYKMSVQYFHRNNLKKPADTTSGIYSMWDSNIIYSMEGVNTFISKEYYVTTLDEEKQLFIGKNFTAYDATFIFSKWDSIFNELFMEIKQLDGITESAEVSYMLKPKSEEAIDSIKMIIDIQNYFLQSITIYYNKNFRISEDEPYGPILKFLYKNYTTAPIDENIKNKYSITNYVTITKKNMVNPAKAYKGYNIVNNLKIQ